MDEQGHPVENDGSTAQTCRCALLAQFLAQGIASARRGQEEGTPEAIFYAAVGYEAALLSLARHLDIPLPPEEGARQ